MVTRIWKSVHISELQLPPSKLCKSPFWPLVFLNMKKNPRHSKGESQVKIKKKKKRKWYNTKSKLCGNNVWSTIY